MERTKITDCELICELGYDKEKELLEIVFNNGDVFRYEDVPVNIFISFMTAPSHSTFYQEYVKHHFEYHRVMREGENTEEP